MATLASCSGDGSAPSSAASPQADTSASSQQVADVHPSAQILTPDGWGSLRVGMTRAEVVAAAGEDAQPNAVGGPDPDRCDEFRPSGAPDGVLVMVEDGVLTRISVSRNPDITTPEGFGIGDASSSVIDAYGSRARIEPHSYWQSPAKYVTVWRESSPPGDRRGIRYEIDSDDQVVHLRAGGTSIEYVEGCL